MGWVTYGSSRLILVELGNLRFLQVLVGLGNLWFLQVNPGIVAETLGFHESPSYPKIRVKGYSERMESITEKTLRWNLRVIVDFLNLGSVPHVCR